MVAFGTALVDDDPDRIGTVAALGLDETLFTHQGPWRRQLWSTSIADVRAGRLLDIVAGRSSAGPCPWLAGRGQDSMDGIEFATLDLSGPLPGRVRHHGPAATQVADPFHLVKLANAALDECRRRVQDDALGHRGRKANPLYRCRRLLTKAGERLADKGRTKLLGLVRAGDPRGEVTHLLAQTGDRRAGRSALRVVADADVTSPRAPPRIRPAATTATPARTPRGGRPCGHRPRHWPGWARRE